MPNLLAMSFEGELAPSFDLRCLAEGRPLPDGWGLGYYPGGEPSATVLKEPAPPQGSMRSQLARAWEHLEASLFTLHIRTATWGAITDANTQPFVRSWGRRDWMIAHAGSLARRPAHDGESDKRGVFEAVGSTDTEQIFCHLMNRFVEKGWRSLLEADLAQVRDWLDVLNDDGELTICLADGRDLLGYADRGGLALHLGTIAPPYERIAFGNDDLHVDLSVRGTKSRKGAVICTAPLPAIDGAGAPTWQPIPPGHLVLVRQGAVIADFGPPAAGPRAAPARARRTSAIFGEGASSSLISPSVAARELSRPSRAEIKRWRLRHRTVYTYAKPVARSSHLLRVQPVHDRLQHLEDYRLTVSVPGQVKDYDDVFGNRVRRLIVETPFTELVIDAASIVCVRDVSPLDFRTLKARSTIPLVWMPWQRQILAPFLLPLELPETQLDELTEYAMSFVKRNDYDLLDTLIDINATIFREYEYRQGSTTVLTTPFEAYTLRRGVCQDFANLFICLARLLGVPARYVCGYIHTGPRNPNQVQSEASHAWVQLYLPEVGWKGFDPTNGVLTQTSHIRVAVGRNYIDATPTSGTIYVGGGPETLEVEVTCEPAE